MGAALAAPAVVAAAVVAGAGAGADAAVLGEVAEDRVGQVAADRDVAARPALGGAVDAKAVVTAVAAAVAAMPSRAKARTCWRTSWPSIASPRS